TFSYDSAGRLSKYAAASLPGGVADDVIAIGRTYDDVGRVEKVTSYVGSGTNQAVVNEGKFTYAGWGNGVKSEQAHDGAVSGGTPAVQYEYDDGFNGTNATF